MNTWTLLAIYAATIVVLQVMVYLYYRRRHNDQGERGGLRTSFPNHEGGSGGQSPGAPGSEANSVNAETNRTVTCPHCGATNEADPVYTYCRNCGGELRH